MGAYNPMSYHNGSIWPHDTAIAIAGLMRYAHIPGAAALAERLADGLLDAAAAFGGRLPEPYCGFPRTQFSSPVPYPTSCSPQAWASAAPLLLVRSFLRLEPNVPYRRLAVQPRLPKSWGRVALTEMRLGDRTVHIQPEAEDVKVDGRGLPRRRLPAGVSATGERDHRRRGQHQPWWSSTAGLWIPPPTVGAFRRSAPHGWP
jgi:hypothetical protein